MGFCEMGWLAKERHNSEKDGVDFCLLSDGRQVLDVSYTTTIHCLVEDKVWSTIYSLLVWILWNAICKCIFSESQIECSWVSQGDMDTLSGWYEAITSEPF